MVKRIRGISCSVRVSPAIANRMVESAKGILLKFLPDIYIHTDHCRGAASGKSPGIYQISINKFIISNNICCYNIDYIYIRFCNKFDS